MCVFFQYSADSEPRDSRYAMSHTSELDTSITIMENQEMDTSITIINPDFDSSEPKSQEQATVRFMYRTLCAGHYVQNTVYRTLCTGHCVQTLCTDTMYRHYVQTLYVQDAMYRTLLKWT